MTELATISEEDGKAAESAPHIGAFRCWRTEYMKKKNLVSVYEWSEAAQKCTTAEERINAELKYHLSLLPSRDTTPCGGDGRCYVLLTGLPEILLPADAPFRRFVQIVLCDPMREPCRCTVKECRNYVQCQNWAPRWYLWENGELCPDCALLKATFIREVNPCNDISSPNYDLIKQRERRVCITEPYLVEFKVGYGNDVVCDECDKPIDWLTPIATFSNCHHQLCAECSMTAIDGHRRYKGQIVCSVCLAQFLGTCTCGLFDLCDGKCLQAFKDRVRLSHVNYNIPDKDHVVAMGQIHDKQCSAWCAHVLAQLQTEVMDKFLYESSIDEAGVRVIDGYIERQGGVVEKYFLREDAVVAIVRQLSVYVEKMKKRLSTTAAGARPRRELDMYSLKARLLGYLGCGFIIFFFWILVRYATIKYETM